MDNTLKHRLIGATVLVALAVIFLPALVKGPTVEGGAADVPLAGPAAPSDGRFQTRELPLVVPSGAGEAVTGLPAPAETVDAPAADPAIPAAAVAAGDHVVNFGAYDSQANAGIVVDMLAKAGLAAYVEPTSVGGRAAWRVRIGPFADRAAAEAARVRASAFNPSVNARVVVLDHADGADPVPAALQAHQEAALPPRTAQTERAATAVPPAVPTGPAVAALPVEKPVAKPAEKPVEKVTDKPADKPVQKPAAPAPAPAPAAPAVGWAVQLGAFSNADEAAALRDRLRSSGFSAFVEQVPTERGSLTRVRVGPVGSREAAEQLRAQVAARQGVSGMVIRHP